jgi:hypothetical protein
MITIDIPFYAVLNAIPPMVSTGIFLLICGCGMAYLTRDQMTVNPFFTGGILFMIAGAICIFQFVGVTIISSIPTLPTFTFPIQFRVT